MGTFFVSIILLFIVFIIIKKMIRDKKSGKSIQCGCDCEKCRENCH